MTRAIIEIDPTDDRPVLVIIVPLRKCCSECPAPRAVIDTTAEPLPNNVVQLRRVG